MCYLTYSASGRKILSLQRTRFRLFRTARKLGPEYVTISAYEEAARCLSFDVFGHESKTRHTLQIREGDAVLLASRTPTPDEKEALQSAWQGPAFLQSIMLCFPFVAVRWRRGCEPVCMCESLHVRACVPVCLCACVPVCSRVCTLGPCV